MTSNQGDTMHAIRDLRLPAEFYETRRTIGGGDVRDAMPHQGAEAYVTDGERFGIRYTDGLVDWMGTDIVAAFGDGARAEG
jgi:hypothetical protein